MSTFHMRSQQLAHHFKGRGPVINIVLDGWGIGHQDETDAIFQAQTPNLDRLMRNCAHGTVLTHGPYVGLPSPKDIGGSEVGHLTLGAGRVFPQGPTRIKELIESGKFFKGETLNKLINHVLGGQDLGGGGVSQVVGKSQPSQGPALHLIGLLSDGNVHSHSDHFYTLINHARTRGVRRVCVHALLDGRDVPYQSALDYVEPLEAHLTEINREHPGWDYVIASGGGREVITMDRDRNWDKVARGWNTHVHGTGSATFPSAVAAIKTFRERMPDAVDQDLPPFVVTRDGRAVGSIEDGHAVVFMNFRGDRAIEFSQAMVEKDFHEFDCNPRPRVMYAGMMVYDEDTNLPPNRLVGAAQLDDGFGRRVLELGLYQFRLAETQKYAHVTFFFNGGYREPLDPSRETYYLIPSDKIDSYAEAPIMKAREIAAKACEFIRSNQYRYGLINFANTDMVGHTGNLVAATQAAEAVDTALGQIMAAVAEVHGLALITADHGNADEMISENPKTRAREPNTRHSLNPVPMLLYDPYYRPGDYRVMGVADGNPLTLSRIAATNYLLLGRQPPNDIDDPLII